MHDENWKRPGMDELLSIGSLVIMQFWKSKAFLYAITEMTRASGAGVTTPPNKNGRDTAKKGKLIARDRQVRMRNFHPRKYKHSSFAFFFFFYDGQHALINLLFAWLMTGVFLVLAEPNKVSRFYVKAFAPQVYNSSDISWSFELEIELISGEKKRRNKSETMNNNEVILV